MSDSGKQEVDQDIKSAADVLKNVNGAKEGNLNSGLLDMETAQRHIMNKYLNLGNYANVTRTGINVPVEMAGRHGEYNSDSDGFMVVKRKKRPKQTAQVGTADLTQSSTSSQQTNFQARVSKAQEDKKIWLFISRAKEGVTEDSVRRYIADRSGSDVDAVSVKILQTRSKMTDNNCFLVGVKQALKEDIYKADFWPKGIHYQRFNFRIGQHFLDKSQTP